jgi:periplasmic copper chaperone A
MKPFLLTLLLVLASSASLAQTVVTEPWVRATVAQQKASGLFARITSAQSARLVAASSPVAGVVEIHEMRMDGDVMRMRALPRGLELPAGKPVDLAPGGYHLMLMDLKRPLKVGDTVAVTLVIEGADKKRESVVIQAPVKAMDSAAPAMHKH